MAFWRVSSDETLVAYSYTCPREQDVEFALSERVQRRIQVWSEASVIVAALATIPVVILQENGASAA